MGHQFTFFATPKDEHAIEHALRIYLPPDEVDSRIRAVRALLPP